MKNIVSIILLIIFYCSSCKSGKNSRGCIENDKFKEEFFRRITIVEQNLPLNQDSLFRSSLIFLSNYAPVSFYETMNYARIYSPQAFERDKNVWIKWYEDNKCKNLQLKENYPIPEQYQEFFEY
jgi:hypothetical protein